MTFRKRNGRPPLVKIGDGEGERLQIEGSLTGVRRGGEYNSHFYDIATAAGPVSVVGCSAIDKNLSDADVGRIVRLTFVGWGETKSGTKYRKVDIYVDEGDDEPTSQPPTQARAETNPPGLQRDIATPEQPEGEETDEGDDDSYSLPF